MELIASLIGQLLDTFPQILKIPQEIQARQGQPILIARP
ncbi:hypothetical protein EV382_1079 [Micromonospora violae]|uniref:Uncharacterized protein n=1 Tax=Micromonospora violae TaxID=1278207 RepID=A0A4Q7UB82_9ACTN|nr:hypothetical protein EV382_1079 [Micromonospora violae]